MARITTTILPGLALLAAVLLRPAAADEVIYCSSQNTGASGQSFHWDWQSNGWCSDKCSGSYAFAIINAKECWCSNYVPADQSDKSDCDGTCPGYPSEICGSNNGDRFVYFAMEGKTPSGTRGSSQPTSASPSSAPPSPGSSAEEEPNPETIISVVTRSAPVVTVVPTSSEQPSSAAPTTLRTSTSSAEPVTSNRLVTVSGQIITETIILTPSSAPAATTGPASGSTAQSSSGPNVGAIAGGAVGGVLGLIAIVGGVFFLLWRRRKARQEEQDDPRTGIGRNTSTMSKSGLLRTEKSPQYPPRIATNFSNNGNSKRNSRMMQDTESISPISGSDRRNSRPYIFDQRLNPSAIMVLDNTSRGSFASMDDSRDYGRTLNVRNPDPRD